MNKIYKVIYSKVKQCYIVVSELAKSHVKSSHGSNGQQKAALTAAVLLAVGTFSVASVFMPMTAEAADKTRTDGSNFVGVERTNGLLDESKYENSGGKGAQGADSITLGLKAQAGAGTITIGDRNAGASLGSVYVGQGDIAKPKLDTGGWATSIGYNSDATGYGSIALGSNAVAKNSYAQDSKGESLVYQQTVVENGEQKVRLVTKPDIQRASVAIGYGASADNGNIAIGSYSDASTDLRTAKTTDGQEIKSYLTDQKADSYVSVGKTNALRRISNVADGASASDVATVGQLQALSGKVGVYDAGFGIEIASDKDNKTNTISLNRNLGNDYNITDGVNLKNDAAGTSLILGGRVEKGGPTGGQSVTGDYGALGKDSVTVGGVDNTVETTGEAAVVVGGIYNKAAGTTSAVVGGSANDAIGNESAVFGGFNNDATGTYATISGGSNNRTYGDITSVFGGSMNNAVGSTSSVFGGSINTATGTWSSVIGGSHNTALGLSSTAVGGENAIVDGMNSVGIAGGSTNADYALAAGNEATVTVNNGTAIGYQATANQEGTVAFGHDKGDVHYTSIWPQKATEKDGKYYDAKNEEITKDQYEALRNADLTFNDYSQKPTVTENKYGAAAYNRLVKVADGQDDHDVVVMEQLKQYANKDALNLGNNIKVYKTDEKGNVQLDKDKKPVEDTDATTTAQKNSKDAWGKALGAGTLTAATAKDSNQLVTGNTLYDYDTPTGSTNYVKANNTTGQNLSALDAQVKANADELNKPNRNIKYYSVKTLPLTVDGYTNENNDGAKGMGSLAAGFVTHADGIASTVAGSYSGVINSGNVQGRDLRGAAALSYGTFNVNQNTDTAKEHSGVANSIVGQANMTTNSNAAIIYGAGNTVTNSYRPIAEDKASAIFKNVSDPTKLGKAMQDAVKESGGQVMVMGGGNNVESAYMSQVVGVGNTVTGADSTYAEGTSTQYNFVDGFQNELTNGKNDYIIGSNNSVTGDSIDKNQSNIVVGDNHTLTNRKNNVVIGSADKKENMNKELTASDATVIGHNADVTVDGGAAIGSGSVSTATAEADAEGYDPVSTTTNKASTNTSATWKATTGAVSIGGVNGNTTTTRRITNLAAGFNDTDAVNVAQIKKLASVDASNIGKNFKDGDVTTNENAWGEALGTGTVTKDSKQLVTGSTVYNEVRPSKDGKYVKMSQTTGDNLLKLDDQVKTNTDKLSDVDSRSVKYDTKKVNDKTVVDNTKITLAGEGGTTITNLKAGVNANDAATVGQLDARISGVTYKAGDGIKYGTDADNNKTISVNKGDGLKFTEDHKLAVNTGKHLSVNTDGQIDVGDNGTVAENDGNLVTGDTVYKALNGGMTKMIIGTPGKDGTDGKDGTPGTIGLVGPAGTNGQDGAVDITIQKGEDGKDGTKGANGVDGKNGINRIVYEDKNGKHQVATMEDGLKFAGDDGQKVATKAIAKKLNNTVDIIGGADSTKLTANNIGVNNVDGKLKIQLAQELTGITSISGSTGSNGAKITLDTNDQNISVNGGKITDVTSGLSTNDGSYNANDAHNAANISDVNSMISKAVTDAKGETQQNLDKKANVDASNIGTNLKGADGKTAATEDEQKANLNKWGEAIGTGEVKDGSKQLVTGNTVYNAVKDKADKSYVDTQLNTKANTDGSNIDADKFSKKVAIGKINDSDERAVSGKTVHEAINTINGNIDGKANKNLDNIDGAGKNVIKDQARAAVTIDNTGLNTNVVATQDDKNHTTTYTINVEGNGKVAAKDTGLISGDTIYNELRPATDGNYIKISNTTAQNLTSLDTQVKKTSDLINSDGKTIKIGGSDAATKVDVSGKDSSGNSTSRVITGVKTDTNDSTSAASVGYVNDMNAANTQQIYHDMNSAYSHVENDISRAAAGSNALAALHPMQEFDPDDKAQYALGYGHYRNSNAGAVGVFYQPDENSLFSLGASFGNGDAGINAGVTFKFGPGGSDHHALTKTQMAKVINEQSKEIDTLKKENADKDKRIDALEQKVNEILAKVEKDKA